MKPSINFSRDRPHKCPFFSSVSYFKHGVLTTHPKRTRARFWSHQAAAEGMNGQFTVEANRGPSKMTTSEVKEAISLLEMTSCFFKDGTYTEKNGLRKFSLQWSFGVHFPGDMVSLSLSCKKVKSPYSPLRFFLEKACFIARHVVNSQQQYPVQNFLGKKKKGDNETDSHEFWVDI